jgi:hypothetical protein
MYLVKRKRNENGDVDYISPMKDGGKLYYTFLVHVNKKVESWVGIVSKPSDIMIGNVLECVMVGPMPLEDCHKLGVDIVTQTRGFHEKRSKLDFLVDHMELDRQHYVHHWSSPLPLKPISLEAKL